MAETGKSGLGHLDAEVQAIQVVLTAITKLDEEGRARVLDYVSRKLGVSSPRQDVRLESPPIEVAPTPTRRGLSDIRSLTAEKAPRTAIEMTAIVGYYLSELAPANEQTETITTSHVQRYFKQAGFPLPKAPRMTLPTAAAAGYFDQVGPGRYRLNPVGYNLVAHALPLGSTSGGSPKRKAQRPRSSKPRPRKGR